MKRLAGKVARVSGEAASRLFTAEGAALGIRDLPTSRGAALAAELSAAGTPAAFAAADVSEEAQVTAAVAEAELGAVTVPSNHAGTLVVKPFPATASAPERSGPCPGR